ncbi:MAG TPA: tape measure protein, partial [Ferruginibacter sp.]|nr:tape measure protein [Ferruginibacter sp.]
MRGHAGAPRGGGMFGGMMGGMRGMMPMLGPAAAIAAIVGGGANVIGQGIEKFTEFQATNKSFEVLTGDKNIGQKLSKDLNKLQLDTILGPEVFKNAQTMLAFGIGAEEVIPSLKMLGDVSMGDAEKMKSLTLAFSQMRATGKLTGQDLLQMVNAGFNPLAEISRKTGKSLSELKDQMEKGNISSAMVTQAFKDATSEGGKFNNMLEQMKHTRKGFKAALEGQIEQDLITIGESLHGAADMGLRFKASLISLITPTKNLQDAIISEKNSINTLVGSITAANQHN